MLNLNQFSTEAVSERVGEQKGRKETKKAAKKGESGQESNASFLYKLSKAFEKTGEKVDPWLAWVGFLGSVLGLEVWNKIKTAYDKGHIAGVKAVLADYEQKILDAKIAKEMIDMHQVYQPMKVFEGVYSRGAVNHLSDLMSYGSFERLPIKGITGDKKEIVSGFLFGHENALTFRELADAYNAEWDKVTSRGYLEDLWSDKYAKEKFHKEVADLTQPEQATLKAEMAQALSPDNLDHVKQESLLAAGFHAPFARRIFADNPEETRTWSKYQFDNYELDLNEFYSLGAWLFGTTKGGGERGKIKNFTASTGRTFSLPSAKEWDALWAQKTNFTTYYGTRDRMFKWGIWNLKGGPVIQGSMDLKGTDIEDQYINPHDYYNRLLAKGVTMNSRGVVNKFLNERLKGKETDAMKALETILQAYKDAEEGKITEDERDQIVGQQLPKLDDHFQKQFDKHIAAHHAVDELIERWVSTGILQIVTKPVRVWDEKEKKYVEKPTDVYIKSGKEYTKESLHHLLESLIKAYEYTSRRDIQQDGMISQRGSRDVILEEWLEEEA